MTNNLLKNLANYRIGRRYNFIIDDKPTMTEVEAKGNRKLQLNLLNGKVKWFNSDVLTVAKDKHKKSAAKPTVVEVEKPVVAQKPTVVEAPKVEPKPVEVPKVEAPKVEAKTAVAVKKVAAKPETVEQKPPAPKATTLDGFKPHSPVFINNQWVDYWEHQHWLFLNEFRKILSDKNYDVKISPRRLLDLVEEYLPDKD